MTYPKLTWKKEDLENDIQKLSEYAIAYAEENRVYYAKNSRFKRTWARYLRIIAIVSTALGGLLPILSQILEKYNYNLEPAWATVAITTAVTAIGFDRFFGFSSAWMRFVTTELRISSKIEELKLSLENERFALAGELPTFDTAKPTLHIIGSFINEISGVVKDETNTWMVEFQNVIQKFNEEINVKAENVKLGALSITIENAQVFKKGVRIQLENNEAITFFGSSHSFNNLFPKIYKLSISGVIDEDNEGVLTEKELQNQILVNVTGGNVTTASIQLK